MADAFVTNNSGSPCEFVAFLRFVIRAFGVTRLALVLCISFQDFRRGIHEGEVLFWRPLKLMCMVCPSMLVSLSSVYSSVASLLLFEGKNMCFRFYDSNNDNSNDGRRRSGDSAIVARMTIKAITMMDNLVHEAAHVVDEILSLERHRF